MGGAGKNILQRPAHLMVHTGDRFIAPMNDKEPWKITFWLRVIHLWAGIKQM